MSKEPKISEEIAQEQLDQFLEYYDIDPSDCENRDDVRAGLEISFKGIKRSIMNGHVEMIQDDEGDILVKQVLEHKVGAVEELIYKPCTAIAKAELDTRKVEGQDNRITYLMGKMCGRLRIVQELKAGDEKRMKRLGGVFLM